MKVNLIGEPKMVLAALAAGLEGPDPLTRERWEVATTPSSEILDLAADGNRSNVAVIVNLGPGVPAEIALARQALPGVGLVWLAADPGGRHLASALGAGCSAVVSESDDLDDLRHAIVLVANGQSWMTSEMFGMLTEALRDPTADALSELSAREMEVLDLLCAGRTTRQISEELYISVHTASNHIRHVLAKFGVHSRIEAVALASGRRHAH